MTSARPIPDKFLVAFSFAGEQRELVRSIAEAVEQRLGRGTVFFDEWYEHYLAGAASDDKLQKIYGEKTELVVVAVSGQYGSKPWTLAESDAVRARLMQLRSSPNKQDADRILPLRVADGDVPGILFNTIAPDVRNRAATVTAELILNRLQMVRPDPELRAPSASPVNRRVFLAECTPDLEVPTEPINRECMKAFLESLGWTVLPSTEYPADQYQSLLETDLRDCLAFVQLLGPYPWKRGGFDRLQNEAATKIEGLKRFRFRSSDIELDKVDSPHREFLAATGVIAAGFEDFKHHVEKELTILSQETDRGEVEEEADVRHPRILVAIRSRDPDALWDKVFQWFYEEQQIESDLLPPNTELEVMYRSGTYHGFVIVCDAAGLEEGPLSPRNDLIKCSDIQFELRKQRKPLLPVAIVYWPPPDPAWARLLRTQPPKLVRLLGGDKPANLAEFLDKVREVAQ